VTGGEGKMGLGQELCARANQITRIPPLMQVQVQALVNSRYVCEVLVVGLGYTSRASAISCVLDLMADVVLAYRQTMTVSVRRQRPLEIGRSERRP
jgi:hypothetical protein